MKKLGQAALAAAVLLTLTGCGETETTPPEPVAVETLALEFAPVGGDPMEQLRHLTALEDTLREALWARGAEVETVSLTLGSSPEATAQALAEGGVDAALLPGSVLGEEAEVLAAQSWPRTALTEQDLPSWQGQENRWTEEQGAGCRVLILAGPSDYGQNLASRAEAGPTWTELQRAVWGIPGPEEQAAAEQWLTEQWPEASLQAVTRKGAGQSPAELLEALARGQIDVAVLAEDLRIDQAEAWTRDWGRSSSIWQETTVLALTGETWGVTAAVGAESPWNREETLRGALAAALTECSGTPDFQALSGTAALAMQEMNP